MNRAEMRSGPQRGDSPLRTAFAGVPSHSEQSIPRTSASRAENRALRPCPISAGASKRTGIFAEMRRHLFLASVEAWICRWPAVRSLSDPARVHSSPTGLPGAAGPVGLDTALRVPAIHNARVPRHTNPQIGAPAVREPALRQGAKAVLPADRSNC